MSATTDAATLRELPDGRTVEFHETPRRAYYLCSSDTRERMPSVTTILGILNKPAIVRWSEAQGAAGALAAVRMGELDPAIHADDEAIDVVRGLGLGADAAKKKAADRGLSIHDALQAWCFDGAFPAPADMSTDARPYLQGLARLLLSLDPTPIVVERIVCHPDLKYAGRLDLVAEIDGVRTLLDLKTSRTGRPYPEAHVQAVGYAAAEQAVGEPWPDRIIVAGVAPDGTFCVDECAAPADAFERIVGVYRLMAEVRKPIEAAARAAKKAAAA